MNRFEMFETLRNPQTTFGDQRRDMLPPDHYGFHLQYEGLPAAAYARMSWINACSLSVPFVEWPRTPGMFGRHRLPIADITEDLPYREIVDMQVFVDLPTQQVLGWTLDVGDPSPERDVLHIPGAAYSIYAGSMVFAQYRGRRIRTVSVAPGSFRAKPRSDSGLWMVDVILQEDFDATGSRNVS
jgi:hypothetical protein